MPIRDRTDDELKQLASDLKAGWVFTNRHVEDANMLSVVFIPLGVMDEDQVENLREDNPGLIYEYLAKAGPRSVNGLPTFFSMNLLNQSDATKVFELVAKLKEAEDNALAE